MKKSLLTRLKTFMLLFSGLNLFLQVFSGCQGWPTVIMGKKGLEIKSNCPTKQATAFNFPIGSLFHRDYPLSGDNESPEIRTSLTLKSGWWRQIFPILR